MKYTLLKFFDITGLTFLNPVVRLCYGEEPRLQLRRIGQLIVVPVLAVIAFVVLWSQIAPRHKTKAGEVPTPAVVWNAADGIWQFHQRENEKQSAYELTGPDREVRLANVQRRLTEMDALIATADANVTMAEGHAATQLNEIITSAEKAQQPELERLKCESARRQTELATLAESVRSDDAPAHDTLLAAVSRHNELEATAAERTTELRAEIDGLRSAKSPVLAAARQKQTELVDEKQYLQKVAEQLSKANRAAKLDDATARREASALRFAASTGAEALAAAKLLAAEDNRIAALQTSEYARPWTLPDQIVRSLACVFFGFVLSAVIAIPIGILCGLNSTFMSAMTPFIALFKPVSPIVWLPIALIIVGGFIPDPEKHWLMKLLGDIPLLGSLKVNPAFIASGVTVALCSMWPTLVNTALGVASIEKDHMNVARVLRLGFWSRMTKIVIPSALPLIFAGLRISLGVGWMVLIAAELLSSSEGIGKFIWDQFNNGASDSFARMVAVVFVVGAIGFLLDRIMVVLQRAVSFEPA